jgi:hypothetical protein
LEVGGKRVCAGLLKTESASEHIVVQNKTRPYISVSLHDMGVRCFKAAGLVKGDGRHNMTECYLVMDVDPEASMIGVRAKSKLKVTSLDHGDGWRGKDAVNRV